MIVSKKVFEVFYNNFSLHFRNNVLHPGEGLTYRGREAKLESESLWEATRVVDGFATWPILTIIGDQYEPSIFYRLLKQYNQKPGTVKYVIDEEQLIDTSLLLKALQHMRNHKQKPPEPLFANLKANYSEVIRFSDKEMEEIETICLLNEILEQEGMDTLDIFSDNKKYDRFSHTFRSPYPNFKRDLTDEFRKEKLFIKKHYQNTDEGISLAAKLDVSELLTAYYYNIAQGKFDIAFKFWGTKAKRIEWGGLISAFSKEFAAVRSIDGLNIFDIDIECINTDFSTCTCQVFYTESFVNNETVTRDLRGTDVSQFVDPLTDYMRVLNHRIYFPTYRIGTRVVRIPQIQKTKTLQDLIANADSRRNRLKTVKLECHKNHWYIFKISNTPIN
jgi:hypothetical protein